MGRPPWSCVPGALPSCQAAGWCARIRSCGLRVMQSWQAQSNLRSLEHGKLWNRAQSVLAATTRRIHLLVHEMLGSWWLP